MKTHNSNAACAIVARYHGPTNSRGARIIVTSKRGRKTYPYPYHLSESEVYVDAVDQYLRNILDNDRAEYGEKSRGWGVISEYSVGVLPTGEHVFVSNH